MSAICSVRISAKIAKVLISVHDSYQVDIKDAEDPIHPNLDDDDDEAGEDGLLDSDDDEELSERMAGVDLDDADAIWRRLTAGERKEFGQLVDTGDISKMVPEFKAWWEFM